MKYKFCVSKGRYFSSENGVFATVFMAHGLIKVSKLVDLPLILAPVPSKVSKMCRCVPPMVNISEI